mgnify:CR=1 FL=1
MVELLAPAGNIESLDAAIGEGADAVYLGLKSFNARLRTTNFAWNQFEATVEAFCPIATYIQITSVSFWLIIVSIAIVVFPVCLSLP